MQSLHFFNIFLFLSLIMSNNSANIGFFCNTGAYSHDVYSSYLAKNLESHGNHNVSIIQIKVFNFHQEVHFSNQFQRYVIHNFTNDTTARRSLQQSQKLMWEMILPFDIYNGSFIGIRILLDIQKCCVKACDEALANETFLKSLRDLSLNLLIIDDGTNDCASGVANALNVRSAYISSTPFGSNSFDLTGVPANPAYVPVFFCNYEPYENVFNRFLNVFGFVTIVGFRLFSYSYKTLYNLFYEKLNLQFTSWTPLEKRALLLATPWEMFLDMPRPLGRTMRYFGCERCSKSVETNETSSFTEKTAGIILVSFGTFVSAKEIPVSTLQQFVKAFAYFPHHIFIWQLDLPIEYFQKNILPISMEMPKNVRLHRWIPIMELLHDPKVILLITHGGATTALEAVYSGTPVLGVAINLDQYSNTQRFAHRGLGEMLTAVEVTEYTLFAHISMMLGNYNRYKQRAIKFRDMLIDYRNFEKLPSVFWIDFLARHFSSSVNETASKLDNFWVSHHPTNWIIYFGADIFLMVVILWICVFSMLYIL